MADIRLAKPAAGTTQTVPSAPNGRFIFDFPADAATLTRNGDDLVLTFEDGSSIQLQGFYTTYSKEEMPSFQVEGVEISGQDFFAALGEDLMPAAGPAASSASRSGRYNEYGGSDLLDGIDHLGRLDIGFDGGTQLATDTVEPSAPEVDIDYDVTIAAGPEAGAVDLTVYEGGLAGGSQVGQAATPTTASGSLSINAPDGVASIVIGDVVVYENGKLTGNVVTTDEGTLAVTGYDPVTGKLDFSYTLDRNTTEHDKSDPATDTQISHDLTVTVTDTDGDSDSTTITVNVVDDVPTIGSFSHEMSEGDAVPVVGNALTGAVAGADGANFAWDANQNGHFGTITLNADGTYSYRLDNDNATVKELTDGETLTEEFTYTYTDADGDIAEGKVTITINGKDNGIVIEPTDPAAGSDTVTVYESGLADGSQAGQDDAPTTASGSLIITAPDGVASIVIGGIVVFEKGGLTGNTVSTDEGTLAVTGFDPVTGELTFTYQLSGNTTEHSGSGMDDISHDLTVTVTDMDGTEVDSTITVNVVDDVPVVTQAAKGDATEAENDTADSTLSGSFGIGFGADGAADAPLSINGATGTKDGNKTTFDVDGGKLVVTDNGDGNYSYEYQPSDPNKSFGEKQFMITATDKDGDSTTVEITVKQDFNPGEVEPGVGENKIVVDEGTQPEHGGEESHGQNGNGSFIVDLHGEGGTIEVGGWTISITDGVATVSGSAQGVHGVELSNVEAELGADGKWTVNYDYALGGRQEHGADGSATDADLTGNFPITVTDATGDKATGSIDVTVHDDVPVMSASDVSTTVTPGSGAGNLADGEAADFTKGNTWDYLGHSTSLSGWEGVTMTAAKVYYNGFGDNVQIGHIDTDGSYSLKYSPYKNNGNGESDWGLTVDAGEHNEEISVIGGNASEAVVFDLGGQLAYGVTIDFGAFYNGEPGATGTTQWDHVSEKALVTFYRDGQIVGSTVVEGNSPDGKFTLNSSDVVLGGFDKVVISAVDNSTTQFPNENSDFTIQGIDFITKRDDPIIINEGKVTAESGADGFADAYADSHAKFDLAGMVDKNGGTLNEDGTSGTIMVLMDGSGQKVTLELSEGLSGESILTGTLADGEQLFTATLDKDGNWTMEQYDQFHVPGEGGQGSSNEFDLVFKTEDADGDTSSVTVQVPLEVQVASENNTGSIISNGDDVIIIDGGDGVAGTVAAGDSGGMTEGQQVEANYNVCFILDTSGSMDEKVGGSGSDRNDSRLEVAVKSIENFIDTSIHQGDFIGTVNLAVVTFESKYGKTIDVSISRVSDGDGGYTESYVFNDTTYNSYDSFKSNFHNTLNGLNANGGTNYEAGFRNAADWFDELGDTSKADGNITYFLSDGVPTYHGTNSSGGGNYATEEDIKGAWLGYQDLLGSASGMQVNAIGFGTDLDDTAMKTLAMLDNTGTLVSGVAGNQEADGFLYFDDGKWSPSGTKQDYVEYESTPQRWDGTTYYTQLGDGSYQQLQWKNVGFLNYQLGYYTGGRWHEVKDNFYTMEEIPLIATGGNATQVTNGEGLTAAFENGFKPGTLTAAGNDTIRAEHATSSAIIYGDVINTDRLLHELKQNDAITQMVAAGMITALPGYGSGSELFQWLEKNSDKLTGDYAGWTHDDTIKYMLEHAGELGYETRVAEDGTAYLVKPDGTVLDMDGSEATDVDLGSLTGRDGGDDIITGSSASDIIYGQEGHDTIYGGGGHDGLYGGTGDDLLVGDDKPENLDDVTVEGIKDLTEDELDDFIKSVEGTDDDGNDQLFGGVGDDVLLGMGGDDYLDGGAGEDAIFGGAGNDIIVYDKADYLVSGGSGIDFMVSDDKNLTLDSLLSNTGSDKPLVSGIEVLLKGDAALSLTSIQDLADRYGITLGTNADGQETLTLDMSKWNESIPADGTHVFTSTDNDLTLETNLQHDAASSSDNGEMAQQVFILENTNS